MTEQKKAPHHHTLLTQSERIVYVRTMDATHTVLQRGDDQCIMFAVVGCGVVRPMVGARRSAFIPGSPADVHRASLKGPLAGPGGRGAPGTPTDTRKRATHPPTSSQKICTRHICAAGPTMSALSCRRCGNVITRTLLDDTKGAP